MVALLSLDDALMYPCNTLLGCWVWDDSQVVLTVKNVAAAQRFEEAAPTEEVDLVLTCRQCHCALALAVTLSSARASWTHS